MRSASRTLLALSLLSLLGAGCGGGSDVPRADVEGTVTFQGTPIEEGFIQFIPVEGVNGALVQLNIKDGKYSSRSDSIDSRGVVIGQNDIQIMAMKKTGKQVKNPMNEMEDEVIQYIPTEYNSETTLREDVKQGNNHFDFDLK